jgi:hypothetical protein
MDVAGMNLEIGGEEGLRLEFTFGSRTRSQRIGTGATPARYQSAVPPAISTRRSVRPSASRRLCGLAAASLSKH